tara:strand:+ start:15550 stop:15828 length:279 start_codon:yes stop_codon:yes gene_type:complete
MNTQGADKKVFRNKEYVAEKNNVIRSQELKICSYRDTIKNIEENLSQLEIKIKILSARDQDRYSHETKRDLEYVQNVLKTLRTDSDLMLLTS